MEIYCLSCKENTKSKNVKGKITKNNKPYLISNCHLYNKLKSKFISIKQIKGNGILGNSFKNIPILNILYLINLFHYYLIQHYSYFLLNYFILYLIFHNNIYRYY